MSLNAKEEEQWVRVQVKKHDTDMKNLRLLAEAVLEAHSKHYPQAYHVGCEACRVAREVMG